MYKILILPGDGIGTEIICEARKVLDFLVGEGSLNANFEQALVGGAAVDVHGVPLPEATLEMAKQSDAVLFGAIGGPKWESIDRQLRPERGLLQLRSRLGVFANLRPAVSFPQLLAASSLRPEVVRDLDIMFVRELTGGIYFGEPRGIRRVQCDGGSQREGFNTLVYSESEIRRIATVAFEIAGKRRGRLCSVDKANVLEATELWREVVTELAAEYPQVALSHMYVDNASMQLVREPGQFDVVVTTNLFGDILSDLASMLTGSIGMLASASLDERGRGLYEPIHGSAPDIAGTGRANPLATILSVAMMLRHSLNEAQLADRIECAVAAALDAGLRTADIAGAGQRSVSTTEMGDAVVAALGR